MTSKYYLPSKIITYLKRLRLEYTREGNALYSEIIDASRVYVREGTSYDNWNGGTYGHDVLFFLPADVLQKIPLANQSEHIEAITKSLNVCAASVDNEFFNSVYFEHVDDNDRECQQAVSVSSRPEINPDTLVIWKPGQIRVFISHRDNHKRAAKTLGEALEGYGISAFVAHDTIEPMATWQNEIIKGLETMEVMLAFVTDDFHDSIWANQEVGFALGRNVPIVSLKLQASDPRGFIANVQALRGRIDDPASSAPDIYKLIAEKLGNKNRLQGALIGAFVQSPNFDETRVRFDRMNAVVNTLSEEEQQRIVRGFAGNDQLYNAIYRNNRYGRLRGFLKRASGREYIIDGRKITSVKEEEEIPF